MFSRCSFWKASFSILDASREPVLKIQGPCCICNCPCCDVDFKVTLEFKLIKRDGRQC